MTAGFIGLLCTFSGIAIGWLLRSEDVWAKDARIRQLADDLAYATGHPVSAARRVPSGNVVLLRGEQ